MAKKPKAATFIKDPLWYKDAVIYKVHVKSFFDSNNSGSATFPVLLPNSITLPIWASTPFGCCRSNPRHGVMTVMTSPNTVVYTPITARWPTPSGSFPRPTNVACV